ncbi:hypothetical protein TorRG33x02_217050 [Trema orientale]|uniref:Uncharacterized protein n=1 Tax=Trema orientale TaxID=63057 RepID=A0A2P5EAD7_TREOI|nr:hypothetical protein TorRG33x02_217050 [Trema orientale]
MKVPITDSRHMTSTRDFSDPREMVDVSQTLLPPRLHITSQGSEVETGVRGVDAAY